MTSPLRWNTSGITVVGNPGDPLNSPLDAVVNDLYTLYVVEFGQNRVQKYVRGASNGTTVAGLANGLCGSSAYQLYSSSRIIVDLDSGIYVSDTYNSRIQF
jgi:hypothetical protein